MDMKIKELLNDPSKWTKDSLAKNKNGITVATISEDACCWCLLGAMYKCYSGNDFEYAFKLLTNKISVETTERFTGDFELVDWNDRPERTFEDVKNIVTELDI